MATCILGISTDNISIIKMDVTSSSVLATVKAQMSIKSQPTCWAMMTINVIGSLKISCIGLQLLAN